MFKGSLTALITPFADGKVDGMAFKALVERQVAEGTRERQWQLQSVPSSSICSLKKHIIICLLLNN